MDKNQDTGTTGVVDLNNTTDVNSGPEITNTQRYINEQADASGVNGIGDATRKTYSSNNVVTDGDNRKVAIGKLDAKFDPGTGHEHTGAAGDAPKIDYVAGLTGTQLKGYLVQGTQLTAVVGSSKDVSTQLTGEANSTGQTVEGVVSTAPNNIVQLLDVNDNNFEDAFGNKVYGRLTFSASVWTLSFYSLIAGVETAYTFASSTINWYYQKLFTESNRPVYSDQSILVSNQLAGEVPDASASLSGKVNITSQTFAGKKTLQDGIVIDASLEIPRTDSASPGASTLTYHPFIRITGSGGDTIQGITAGSDGKTLIIHNSASSAVILSHQNGSASAANRLFLPNAADITLDTDSSIELIYDSSDATWVIKSGSGNGSGSGSSSGEKNFITNPDFESNANGYTIFADAAATSPVDGTGGSPNVTFVRSTSSPLRGNASGLLTKDAVNRQGEGFSYDLTIDSIDAGKELILSGDYSFSANYLDADVGVWVYDTTNNTLIVPYPISGAGDNNLHQSAGRYLFSFQSTSSVTYRLIFFIRSTNASAWTGKFDNLFFGSTTQDFVFGPNIQAEKSDLTFIPSSGAFGTISGSFFTYVRIGNLMLVKGTWTNGTVAGGAAKIALPLGFPIDDAKFNSSEFKLGTHHRLNNTNSSIFSNTYGAVVFYDGSDNLNVYIATKTDGTVSAYEKTVGTALVGSGEISNVEFTVPIKGWSSDVITANSRVFKISDFLANGTRVTGVDPAAIGEYRSYLRNAGVSTYTETGGAPTNPPSRTDGIRLDVATLFASADAAGFPSKYSIFVGKHKHVTLEAYQNTGRTGIFSIDAYLSGTTYNVGCLYGYDPTTGIFTIYHSTWHGNSNNILGAGDTGLFDTAYFDVIVSDNPLPVQIGAELYTSSLISSRSSAIAVTSTYATFDNSPAFTFTPLTTGKYKIYTNAFLYSATAGAYGFCRIHNTSGGATEISRLDGAIYGNSGDHASAVYIQAIFQLIEGNSYVFDIQGGTDAGTNVYLGPFDHSVVPIDSYMYAERIG